MIYYAFIIAAVFFREKVIIESWAWITPCDAPWISRHVFFCVSAFSWNSNYSNWWNVINTNTQVYTSHHSVVILDSIQVSFLHLLNEYFSVDFRQSSACLRCGTLPCRAIWLCWNRTASLKVSHLSVGSENLFIRIFNQTYKKKPTGSQIIVHLILFCSIHN